MVVVAATGLAAEVMAALVLVVVGVGTIRGADVDEEDAVVVVVVATPTTATIAMVAVIFTTLEFRVIHPRHPLPWQYRGVVMENSIPSMRQLMRTVAVAAKSGRREVAVTIGSQKTATAMTTHHHDLITRIMSTSYSAAVTSKHCGMSMISTPWPYQPNTRPWETFMPTILDKRSHRY